MFHHIEYICPDNTCYLFTLDSSYPFFGCDHSVVLPVNFIWHKITQYIATGDHFISRFLRNIIYCDGKLIRPSLDINCNCTPFHNKQLKGCYRWNIPRQVKVDERLLIDYWLYTARGVKIFLLLMDGSAFVSCTPLISDSLPLFEYFFIISHFNGLVKS